MKKVLFHTETLSFTAEFNDSPAAEIIINSLPIESEVSTWGDEIYFSTGITAPSEGATMEVNIGDIAYWPDGKCICIFFGRTPASTSDNPVPASPVVIIGKTRESPESLRKIREGERIRVSIA